MATQQVTDQTFEQEVLKSELPVLVDLYADWCAPCKQMAPLLEELAVELSGKIRVVKVDVEKNPMVAQTFRVQSIPMLVVFAGGQLAGHHVGALDKAGLEKLVEPVLPTDVSEAKPEELAKWIQVGRAVPVDLRDASSYQRNRIPTAIHVDPDQLAEQAASLAPKDGKLRVLYARSNDEAKDAADRLRQLGVEVAYLAGGFLHWEADGFDVERG